MSKLFVFEIGYKHYALPAAQAMALMAALEPARLVEQADWRGPYTFVPHGPEHDGGIVTSMSLHECVEPEPPEPAPETAPLLAITHQPLALASAGPSDDIAF